MVTNGRIAMSALADDVAPSGHGISRGILIATGGTAAAATMTGAASAAEAASSTYPQLRLIALSKLRTNKPVSFEYPLKGQASVLVDLGRAAPHGIGKRKSIVAYSILCQHMGCPVEYKPSLREFVCPCHQSRYDAERLGGIVQGVAMQPLPRVQLSIRNGAVWATGVDGLIYGYRNNLHPGKRVGGSK
jgi:arsenite oxidase small subunit